jgi:DNA-binding NarL/FixJ family response regulator
MVSALQIEKMSRTEKLQAMEVIWADLSTVETDVESPVWHADVLRETEARVAAGDLGEEPFNPLSPREMEILQYITRGMSNKEIARRLGISHQTVKNHVTSILRKFGVEDRTQAVVYALKRGWVTLKDTTKQESRE